jgi:hypothetical protein
MNIDEERAAYEAQLNYLSTVIQRLEESMPSSEEMAYLRNRKLADERAGWAWHMVKAYAPWIATAGTAIGGALWWLLTHTVTVQGPK